MGPVLPQTEGLSLPCQPASPPATILLPEVRPCHLQKDWELSPVLMGGMERAVKLLEGRNPRTA